MTLQDRIEKRNKELAHKLIVDEFEAAELLGRSVITLRNWRHLCKGPAYVKQGRSIGYMLEDLNSFLSSNRIDPEAR